MDNIDSQQGWSTVAVHGGHHKDPRYAHLTPIYASSTFVFDDAEQGMRRFSGEEEGYIYSRWGNPNFSEAEEKIAALEALNLHDENGPLKPKGLLCSSGMAAISTLLLMNLKAGDKILTHFSLYGGTEEILRNLLPGLGIETIITDLRSISKAEAILQQDKRIKMVYLETPANPTLQCVDIAALSSLAHAHGCIVACDNTFATPYLQQPFGLGADYIVHSTTKFLNGHGTSIGGILIGKDREKMRIQASKVHKSLGGNSNAFDAFLLVNGLKTLELRMDRHCANAQKVASFLDQHAAVSKVNYIGLPHHPDHALSQKQMRLPGGMLSFELKGGFENGVKFMNKLRLCTRTVSLGTCDTLVCHPASMTHYTVPREAREKYGISDGLIRVSVGIENVADILNDLEQALSG